VIGLPPPPTRAQLLEQLVEAEIAGLVRTPRESNVRNAERFAAGDPDARFGLIPRRAWTGADVVALMAARVGISPDLEYLEGPDTIDPQRTVDRLDALATLLREVADARGRVLLGTGHPAGVFAIHVEVAAALAGAGCTVLEPLPAGPVEERHGRPRCVRFLRGVAVVSDGGELRHTHSPRPMQAMLAVLAAEGAAPPDFVLADHGFAGAAAQAGIAAAGFADCNDPGLFVAEAEGSLRVAVPLDDNVAPHLYAPLTAYLLGAAGLA
jgi:hypothetical protein